MTDIERPSLDDGTRAKLPPVVGTRDLGQKVRAMVLHKRIRPSFARNGERRLNRKGNPADEEVLTVMILEGNTGTCSGGELNPDWHPEYQQVCRMIFAANAWGELIEARNQGTGGDTAVGDVIELEAIGAKVWQGKGDLLSQGVTDRAVIDKARSKGLSVGWEHRLTYRPPEPNERNDLLKALKLAADIAADNTPRPRLDEPEPEPF